MKVTSYIGNKIARFPNGYVFSYNDFVQETSKTEAIIKALNRMANAGKIEKLSKGRYYKPEATVFGNLQPAQYQIVKDLLEEDGKIIGYLTGFSIYNQLGLTTQVSNIIQIGRNDVRPMFKRERYTISFLRQKNIITKFNIPLLQILDAIRYIKKIPDASTKESIKRLLSIVKDLSDTDKKNMVNLVLKYPPATKSLLGAMLEEVGDFALIEPLRKTLNPITSYKLSGVDKVLSTTAKWNIK